MSKVVTIKPENCLKWPKKSGLYACRKRRSMDSDHRPGQVLQDHRKHH